MNTQQPQLEVLDELIQPVKLVIRKSPLQGYGVFAREDIEKGEILEQAVFSRMRYRTKELVAEEIRQICYTLPCECDTCKYAGRNFVFSSGYINLYNTSSDAESRNIVFNFKHNNRIIEVKAHRDIKKDEEVLNFYGKNYRHVNTEVI